MLSRPEPVAAAIEGMSFRDAVPLASVVWALMGLYDVAVVEMMRPFLSGSDLVMEPALLRFGNHLLLLPVALGAVALLLAGMRRTEGWWQRGALAVVLALLVGVVERSALILIGPLFGGPSHQPTLFELFDPRHSSALTYSARAALKHSEAFMITALMLLVRNQLLQLIAAERERNQAIESDLRSRLAALQNELSPHFMFNALHHAVARAADPGTRAMVVDLGELLRYVLRGRTEPMTTVAEEIEFSKAYLELCAAQGRSVRVQWRVSGRAAAVGVPRLLLHMLVENAYRHATELGSQGAIDVEARVEEARLVIVAENDFVPGSKVRGTGVGLRNIRERLLILYQDGGQIQSTASGPGRWRTAVELPLESAA